MRSEPRVGETYRDSLADRVEDSLWGRDSDKCCQTRGQTSDQLIDYACGEKMSGVWVGV